MRITGCSGIWHRIDW